MNPASTITAKTALIKGAAWHIAGRWMTRGLGFVNTVIMARLLAPEDYGILAMAFLAIGMIQALLDFGAVTALMRKDVVTRDEIDSAWTLRFIQCLAAAVIAVMTTPLVVMYFKEPRLEWVLWVLAGCVIVGGAGNIGLALAQKQFDFALGFKINLIQRVISIAVTVGFGILLGDYRALIAGTVVSYVLPFVLSYTMHPYRPRWNVSLIPEIWAVTKWLMFAGVGGFILRKGDELMAGRLGSSSEYGEYNVGADLGAMPVGEIGPAMLRALLPVLATLKSDTQRTQAAVVKTMAAMHTVIWPIGIGFFALATPATELILGARWIGAAPLVGVFAIISLLYSAPIPLQTYLTLQGHTKAQMLIAWLEFAGFVLAAVYLVPTFHLLGLAYARLVGSSINCFSTLLFVKLNTDFPLNQLNMVILRPALGSILMYILVSKLLTIIDNPLYQILLSILAAAILYITWSIFSWLATNRPEGLESTIFDKISKK